jgi:two-component system sensor histidine kinase/response regulator
LLEEAGVTVTIANNGREAVEMLSGPGTSPFDVVLMDLQMPEMDGYSATAKLRADPRLAALPIIAMTAHATVEERQRCLAAGMNDHVAKPIDPAALFEAVGRCYNPPTVPSHLLRRPVRPQEAPPTRQPLDTNDGLSRVGGSKLYAKILRQFAEQQRLVADAPRRGRGLLSASPHAQGVAGNIGCWASRPRPRWNARFATDRMPRSRASEVPPSRGIRTTGDGNPGSARDGWARRVSAR